MSTEKAYTVQEARRDADGVTWLVDVLRNEDSRLMETLRLTEKDLPPRSNKRGKVAWRLPAPGVDTARLGVHEKEIVLRLFRELRKQRKREREQERVREEQRAKRENGPSRKLQRVLKRWLWRRRFRRWRAEAQRLRQRTQYSVSDLIALRPTSVPSNLAPDIAAAVAAVEDPELNPQRRPLSRPGGPGPVGPVARPGSSFPRAPGAPVSPPGLVNGTSAAMTAPPPQRTPLNLLPRTQPLPPGNPAAAPPPRPPINPAQQPMMFGEALPSPPGIAPPVAAGSTPSELSVSLADLEHAMMVDAIAAKEKFKAEWKARILSNLEEYAERAWQAHVRQQQGLM